MSRIHNVMLVSGLVILPSLAFADKKEIIEIEIEQEKRSYSFLANIAGGMVFSSDAGASGNYNIGQSNFDYDAHKDTQTRGLYGGMLGIEVEVSPRIIWQTGVSYYQTTPFSVKGYMAQGVTPQSSDTYEYTYEILARQLLWENKVAWEWQERYFPYLLVGIGASFNTARDYSLHDNYSTSYPTYDSNRESSFTYSLGLGLDYALSSQLRLGIGYRFADLGKAALGDGELTTPFNTFSTPDLSQSSLYAQELLVQLTLLM